MEKVLKEIESKLAMIRENLDRIEISDNPDYDFEATLIANRDFLLNKREEILKSQMPTHEGDRDAPDLEDMDVSPVVAHKDLSFQSLSSNKDPLRSLHDIPKQVYMKKRSISTSSLKASSLKTSQASVFKSPSSTSKRCDSPSVNRYRLPTNKIRSETNLISLGRTQQLQTPTLDKDIELNNPFLDTKNDDDLVELGRITNAEEVLRTLQEKTKPPEEEVVDFRQKHLIESLAGVNPGNMKQIMSAIAKKKHKS